jgi:hypothetical protein
MVHDKTESPLSDEEKLKMNEAMVEIGILKERTDGHEKILSNMI